MHDGMIIKQEHPASAGDAGAVPATAPTLARAGAPVLAYHRLDAAGSASDRVGPAGRALVVLAAVPATVSAFVPFVHDVSPVSVAAELFRRATDQFFDRDLALGLLAPPFFAGAALLLFRARLLVRTPASRFEAAALMAIAGAAATGTVFFCGLNLQELWQWWDWEVVLCCGTAVLVLLAGVVLLAVLFRNRAKRIDSCAIVAAHVAYLANAAICLLAFRNETLALGWWLTALASAIIAGEAIHHCVRRLRPARGVARRL